ncbi:hypothetical protein CONPUDRAFT_148488 [Coniophora puteana RWD-64-598 SS2]|uniref:GYF domain-containing protein n=1 Tax=Coniophora puteana (strain RWD-64-598) TaxID=741705 RepID=A0A5M3N6A2_CONPW|nr:uncharacterized protein CONPUDRAFT_148488 [Coniophora puteana RWD-64-598 SS2]EIW86395.1 hypothetical protein CONPUDRAFT_148488 [Coniophora puteana RWD-64-598 SS2]
MTATTMHFGPEWMRKPQMPNRPHPPPSPPVLPSAPTNNNHSTSPSGASTYSALVTPAAPEPETRDESHPFRYSKEEMLRIYREGGGRGGLGLEVERHEGIVREVGGEPTGLRELSDAEKKLFAGPLNSELRRRQSGDVVNTPSNSSDRPRIGHNNSAGASPMRERFGSLMNRRRDSTDQPPLTIPRKLSMSNTQGTAASPRDAALPSPRTRMGGFGSGIDGVLSNSDSWVARRRASESTKPGSNTSRDATDGELKGPDIKEEEEGQPSMDAPQGDVVTRDVPSTGAHSLDENHIANGVASIALSGASPVPQIAPPNPHFDSPVPPGLPGNPDPSTIEWSYVDPSGTVQGPFSADIMQKWHEEGYFTIDLLMKRTHIDREFVSVGELVRRAGGGKTFLSQPPPSAPPGLVPRTDSPLHNIPTHQANVFSGQSPVPIRNLRAATLDSYLNANSDSPGSSFDTRFNNGSPDPSAFGGRAGLGMHAGDSPFNGRGYPGRPFNEPLPDPHSPFGNIAPGRSSSVDAYGVYSNNMGAPQWLGQTENTHQRGDVDPSTPYHAFNHAAANIPRGAVGQTIIPEAMSRPAMNPEYGEMNGLGGPFDRVLHGRGPVTNGMSINSANLAYNNPPFVHNQPQLDQSPSVPTIIPQSLSHFSDAQTSNTTLTPGTNPLSSQVQSLNEPSSPWANIDPLLMRPGTTDSPRVSATTPQNQMNQSASHLQQGWSRGSQSSQPGTKRDQSAWLAASQNGTDDNWKEVPGPSSLTFNNVGQHNMMHEEAQPVDSGRAATTDAQIAKETAAIPEVPSEPERSEPEPAPVVSEVQAPIPSKSRRKATTKDTQVQPLATKTTPPSPPSATSPPTPSMPGAVPKAAWLMEDDTKKAGAGMSLREIQEDEARKADARKVEKERERVARASAPVTPAAEEMFTTAAWGLPTSQAGSRTVGSPNIAIPTSAGAAASVAAAPWSQSTNAAGAKKTMKEIQEEEERRKKAVYKEIVAAAPTRRGYAETTTKPLTPAPASGGAWTTVGPSGKSATAAVGARPAPAPTTSSASVMTAPVTSRPSVVAPPRTAASAVAKGTSSAQKADDFPVAPSADFLRWLGENLKGLNSSVNLEEISSMLLSFPLDPDSSTMELIAEMIYTNSTTLDGRRFASEFVNKRKVDAAARKNGASAGPTGKIVSIADVVKTQPKPSQPEWGFKVVNKKKKGGKA